MGKRIAVVGVGALGGYVGGWLAHTGEDVTLIDFWPENIETIRSRGLELDGVTPEEKITVKNAKARPVKVRVIEPMPKTWEITKETHPHRGGNAGSTEWLLDVPAKGQTVLEYNVRTVH